MKINNQPQLENNDIPLEKLKAMLISKYKNQFKLYSEYLSEDFYEYVWMQFQEEYQSSFGINQEIYFDLYIQNKLNKELVEYIKNGDIDLEIELIEKYSPILNLIISKMHLEDKITDKEAILIEALETYNGKRLFSLHIVDTIRNILKRQIIQENNELPQLATRPLEERIQASITNRIEGKSLSYLERLYLVFDLINKTQDINIKEYLYLRCGYYKNIFFQEVEISQIMEISSEKLKETRNQCLILLKNTINTYIDLVISYDLIEDNQTSSNHHQKYIKVK